MMKKRIFIAACTALALSCGPKEPATTDHTLAADPLSLSFGASGNEPQTITVTAGNIEWRAEVNDEAKLWLSAEKTGDGKVAVTVTDNSAQTQRTGEVTICPIASEVKPVVVSVSQTAAEKPAGSISLSPDALSFDWHNTTAQQVTVTTVGEDFTWKASVDVTSIGWLHASIEGNSISVTADDNESDTERRGTINIKPSDPDISGAAITVTQKACGMQPIFSADKTEIHFKAIDKQPQIIRLECVAVKDWQMALEFDDFENCCFTAHASKEDNTIVVEAVRNITKKPRSGKITLSATTLSGKVFDDIVIEVRQEASDSEAVSTLTDDVELTAQEFTATKVMVSSDQLDIETQTTWDLELHDENVFRDPMFGNLAGSGIFLNLRLISSRVTDYTTIPEGVYRVDNAAVSDPETGLMLYDVPAVAPGEYARPGFYGASYIVIYEDDSELEYAPISGGSVEVRREGDSYTIVINLADDAQNAITGTFTGSFDEFSVQ